MPTLASLLGMHLGPWVCDLTSSRCSEHWLWEQQKSVNQGWRRQRLDEPNSSYIPACHPSEEMGSKGTGQSHAVIHCTNIFMGPWRPALGIYPGRPRVKAPGGR